MAEPLEERIVRQIEEFGPLTGAELRIFADVDSLVLWQTCKQSDRLTEAQVGRRYLRLDARLEGYACLSPSILREFLSYTVIGIEGDGGAAPRKADEMQKHIEGVSKSKLALAERLVEDVQKRCGLGQEEGQRICFILAGDIVYDMAHDVPRPEQSTGKLVKGSDIDLVVVADDNVPETVIESIDQAIYSEKFRMLTAPQIREEIDYVVKRMSKVREQLEFDTFRHMVACKILEEGRLLGGDKALFLDIKQLVKKYGISEKLSELETRATAFREYAEGYLLTHDAETARRECLYLFYPHGESDEFESLGDVTIE